MTETAGPSFGPSALVTPANALTAARLLATPIFVAMIIVQGATWATAVVGTLVAGSDGIDGWLARRQGTTRSGAFLDPLADKVVVLGALFALASQGVLSWWPVALISVREVGITAYRAWAGRRGVSIPARPSAKVKTIVQDLAIATCLLPPLAPYDTLHTVAIWVATAFTLVTGAEYLLDGRRALRTTS
ncbi:MAG TPA: CDP-alcohol phosphatidyltransferase family protein [Acidimicrobiales bacterium]|nr:CDP-alcohol phosphatidyltransferase family protein [Acidimicrobiales bacterium]